MCVCVYEKVKDNLKNQINMFCQRFDIIRMQMILLLKMNNI